MIYLIPSLPKQHNRDCREQDFEIKQHRMILDIVKIEQHHLAESQVTPCRDLPEAGDAGSSVGRQLIVPVKRIA